MGDLDGPMLSAIGRMHDQLRHIDYQLDGLHRELDEFRQDFAAYSEKNMATLERIAVAVEALEKKPSFRWPWER